MSSVRLALVLAVVGAAAPAGAAPVGEWRLDEPSWLAGVADSSGRMHPGVALGGAAPVAGHGAFANQPACSDCAIVDIPGDLGVGGASALTVSAWVRWTTDPAQPVPRAMILSHASATTPVVNATTADAGLFWLRTSGDGAASIYQFGVHVGPYNVFVNSMTRPRGGVWTHLTGVYDGARVLLYVDGALEGAAAITGPIAPGRPEYRTVLGAAAADEGPGLGRRPFIGELDEVRVSLEAAPPTSVRADACAAGPGEALAAFCGAAGPMCPACLDLTLTAARWSTPVQAVDGTRELCRAAPVAVPARIPVFAGRAGAGQARLFLDDVTCTYAGGGAIDYALVGCSNSARAGDPVSASRLTLRLDSSDGSAGTTRAAVTVEEAGPAPVVTVEGPAEGALLTSSAPLRASATGATGPLVALLDGAPFAGGEVGAEGVHTFTVTAPACHGPDVTVTRTFTIDRSPPAIDVAGVAEGEQRDGPVELWADALDLTDAQVTMLVDDRLVTGRARVTAPGAHRVVITAIDALGHVTTVERRFTIVDLVTGRGQPADTGTDDVGACSPIAIDQTMAEACNDPCALARGGAIATAPELCTAVCETAAEQAAITSARCQDRAWLDSACGRLEQGKWNDVVNQWIAAPGQPPRATSVCADLETELSIGHGFTAEVGPRHPTGGVDEARLVPGSLSHGDGTVTAVEPRTMEAHTTHFSPAVPGMFHSGGTGTLGAMRRKESVALSTVNPLVTGVNLFNQQRRAAWEANGNQVASCEEYVYEKFYNINKYEDEVARHGGNFRAYVNVAFTPAIPLPLGSTAGSDLVGQGPVLWPAGMLTVQPGSTVSLPPAYAIGTIAERGWPMRARNGTPSWGYAPEALAPTYKNPFFAGPTTNPNGADDLRGVLAQFAEDSTDCTLQYGGLQWIGLCDRELSARIDQGHAISVVRDFAYHHHMSDALAAWSDEDLYLADRLKARYLDLLERRKKEVDELLALVHSAEQREILTVPTPDLPWNLWSSQLDVALVAQQTAAAHGIKSALASPAPAATTSLVGGPNPFAALVGPAQPPLAQITTTSPFLAFSPLTAQRFGSANQAGLTPVGGALIEGPATMAELQESGAGIFGRIAALDRQLELALHEADRMGCLELGDNPCDWSPRDFAQAVAHHHDGLQEFVYRECVRNTAQFDFAALAAGRALGLEDDQQGLTATPKAVHYGGGVGGADKVPAIGKRYAPNGSKNKVNKVFPQVADGSGLTTCMLDSAGVAPFSLPADPSTGLPGNPECAHCNRWTKDTDTMDLYFQCLDQYKGLVFHAVEAKLGPILDEKGQAKLGASTSEQEGMGNDDWALGYDYAFGWTFGNFNAYAASPSPATQCLLQPEMYGSMRFGARAMGKHLDIVRGTAHARSNPAVSDPLFVRPSNVADDLIDTHVDLVVLDIDVVESTSAGGQFHVVKDRTKRDEGDVPTPPIKVPFAIGPVPMSLEAGLSGYVGVRYGAHAQIDVAPPCNHQSLSAHFTPFAGLEGFAAVGLDILVAAAGVKISITIVEVDLPFTESVGLRMDPDDGLTAYFNTNLDLVIRTLGGRFSVYLRILFASWEWDLFTWDGFKHAVNLMHHEMEVPVTPLTEAVQAISGGAMPQ